MSKNHTCHRTMNEEDWKENLMKSDYRYGDNWEAWYKKKDCRNCEHYVGEVSDGFIRCDLGNGKITLPFVQFHERDCDKFTSRSSGESTNE